MALRYAQLLALACIGFSTGIYVSDWAGGRLFRLEADASSAVFYQQVIHIQYQMFMPVFVFGAVLGTGVWLFLIRERWRSLEFLCVAIAFASALAIAIMTVSVSVPINNTLMTWDRASPPADFHEQWAPWDQVNAARCVLASLAFVLSLVAALIVSPKTSAGGRTGA